MQWGKGIFYTLTTDKTFCLPFRSKNNDGYTFLPVRRPRRKEANMDTSTRNPFHLFQQELDTFSTCFQQLFAFLDKSLVFFVFASKIHQLLITRCAVTLRRRPIFQTESKGNFCLMTLYSHKTVFQPQAISAKKQTFSNSACLSLRAVKLPLPAKRSGEGRG
jgi:hypothetical protein